MVNKREIQVRHIRHSPMARGEAPILTKEEHLQAKAYNLRSVDRPITMTKMQTTIYWTKSIFSWFVECKQLFEGFSNVKNIRFIQPKCKWPMEYTLSEKNCMKRYNHRIRSLTPICRRKRLKSLIRQPGQATKDR